MRTITVPLPTITISSHELRLARVLVKKARAVLHVATQEATKDYHDALARTWIEFERIERGPWIAYQQEWRRLRRVRKISKVKRAGLMQANVDQYEAAVHQAREQMISANRKAWLWYRERTDRWVNDFWKDVKPVMSLFNAVLVCEGQREILHPFIDIDAEEWDSLEHFGKRLIM